MTKEEATELVADMTEECCREVFNAVRRRYPEWIWTADLLEEEAESSFIAPKQPAVRGLLV